MIETKDRTLDAELLVAKIIPQFAARELRERPSRFLFFPPSTWQGGLQDVRFFTVCLLRTGKPFGQLHFPSSGHD